MPDSIKMGRLFPKRIIKLVADFLEKTSQASPRGLMSSWLPKRDTLFSPNAMGALLEELVPLCTIPRPNLAEANALVGEEKDFEKLGQKPLNLDLKLYSLKEDTQRVMPPTIYFIPTGLVPLVGIQTH